MPVISSAEFQRNVGLYQDKALTEPVTITKNGRERLVLMSIDEFQRLKRRDRSVFAAEELSTDRIDAIEAVRMDERHRHLDVELKDWAP